MIEVKSFLSDTEYPLYNPRSDKLQIIEPSLTQELNKSGEFKFSVPKQHPFSDKILKLQSEIGIYEDETLSYNGRPILVESDLYETTTYVCEGELGYLLDTQQDPFEHQGSINAFFTQIINNHNKMVDEKKQFKVGKITVVDDNNYINRSSGHYLNTLEVLNTRLIKTHGGFLRIRREKGVRYLDYLSDYGHVNSQVIRFGENILDLSKHIDTSQMCTAVIPLGKVLEDETGINDVKPRTTIESVNNGKKYLVDENARSMYGWICRTVEFDDVEIPENLKKKGQSYLDESKATQLTIELTAVDLSLIDVNIEKINIGDWVRVVSPLHELDQLFLVTKKARRLDDPSQCSITLGKTLDTFTSDFNNKQKEISKLVEETAKSQHSWMNEAIENATNLMTGGSGGYVKWLFDKFGKPEELVFLDKPDVKTAVNLMRLNKNGIGFSNTGINGLYKNAWTIDGQLLGQFIKAKSITAEQLATNAIQVGFNAMGSTMRLTSTSLGFYSASTLTTQLTSRGVNFYQGDSTSIGTIGTNSWKDRPTVRGLNFDMDYQGDYMTWAWKQSAGASVYTTLLTVDPKGRTSYGRVGMFVDTDMFVHGSHSLNVATLGTARAYTENKQVKITPYTVSGVGGIAFTNPSGNSGVVFSDNGELFLLSRGGVYSFHEWVVK